MEYQEVAICNLQKSPMNYRTNMDKGALDELTESVKTKGVLEPLLVREVQGSDWKVEVVAGHRRLRAATLAGLKTVPVRIMELTDQEALEVQVIENSQREDPNPMDEALGFGRLLDFEHTPETLAVKIDRSVAYVLGRLKLRELPKEAQKKVASGEISAGLAMLLTRLRSKTEQKELLKAMTEDNGMTIKRAQEAIKEFACSLSDADFDVAGCASCSFRTKNQAVLFANLKKSDDECMDRSCFLMKTKDWYLAHLEKMEKEGFKVMREAEEIEPLIGDNCRTVQRISEDGGSWQAPKPKKYKSECMKCTEHHAFYSYVSVDWRGRFISSGELCLNVKCFKKMQGLAPDTATGGTGNGKAREHATAGRNRFLQLTMPDTIKGSRAVQKRLMIWYLLDKFDRFEGRDEFIKEFAPKANNKGPYGMGQFSSGIYKEIVNKIDAEKLDKAIVSLLMLTVPVTNQEVLLYATQEAGIDMGRDYSVDESWLKTKTKAELVVLGKKLFKITLDAKSKKGELIETILKEELVGKVPEDIKKVCEI